MSSLEDIKFPEGTPEAHQGSILAILQNFERLLRDGDAVVLPYDDARLLYDTLMHQSVLIKKEHEKVEIGVIEKSNEIIETFDHYDSADLGLNLETITNAEYYDDAVKSLESLGHNLAAILARLAKEELELARAKEENNVLGAKIEKLEDDSDEESRKIGEEREQLAEEREKLTQAPIIKKLGQAACGQMVSINLSELANFRLLVGQEPPTNGNSGKPPRLESDVELITASLKNSEPIPGFDPGAIEDDDEEGEDVPV